MLNVYEAQPLLYDARGILNYVVSLVWVHGTAVSHVNCAETRGE